MRLISHRLAGAVVADERGHLARRDLEIDVRERLHRPEVLRDALEAKEGLGAVLGGRHRVPSADSTGGGPGPAAEARPDPSSTYWMPAALHALGYLAGAEVGRLTCRP